MENTILLFPYAGQLTNRVRRESEVIAQLRKRRAAIRGHNHVTATDRLNLVGAIDGRIEKFYGFANVVAVGILAAALVTSFGIYLNSFVG